VDLGTSLNALRRASIHVFEPVFDLTDNAFECTVTVGSKSHLGHSVRSSDDLGWEKACEESQAGFAHSAAERNRDAVEPTCRGHQHLFAREQSHAHFVPGAIDREGESDRELIRG